MMRIVFFLILILLIPASSNAQELIANDSLKVERILENDEIHINEDLINSIDFGSGVMGKQMIMDSKSWLSPDNTLPSITPNEMPLDKRQILSLKPYKANTPYNWDPIKQKKIRVNRDTWRSDPFYHLKMARTYSNWAKSPFDKGVRSSLAQIEATGLRYSPIGERAGNRLIGTWNHTTSGIGGLDLMTPFTKDFWNRKGVKRRLRTLEVLEHYSDTIP